MSGAATTNTPVNPPDYTQLMGHPRPLWMLFMTEFWERFAFYGIRWALVLYIVAQFHGGAATGEASANQTYGAYLALVYAAAIFGGYVADRIIGYQRSILLGAIIMAAGLFMISMPAENIFKLGLATIIAGNGLFKPNISTMVGKLYTRGDETRDARITLFHPPDPRGSPHGAAVYRGANVQAPPGEAGPYSTFGLALLGPGPPD